MDEIKCTVSTPKAIRILAKNQYTFDVEIKATKTDIKHWVELFFKVKVLAVNSHIPPRKKRRMGSIIGYPVRYKRMIVTISGDSQLLSSLF